MGPLLPDEFNPETFPMLRVLPGLVVRTLRKHFYAGVKEAEVRFRYHRADEDAVTGALGERLIKPEPIAIQVGPRVYLWRTAFYKLRGRGANAPEKELGAAGHLPAWGSGPQRQVHCSEGPVVPVENRMDGPRWTPVRASAEPSRAVRVGHRD